MTLMIPLSACKPSFEQQRASVVEYLTDCNNILNELDRTVNLGLDMPQIDHLNKEIPAYQGAIQRAKSLKVPDIDELKEHNKAILKFMQDWLFIKSQQLGGLRLGRENPAAGGQALFQIAEQLRSFFVSTEAIMQKYNIADSEVGYEFRNSFSP